MSFFVGMRDQEMLAALDKARDFTHGADACDRPWHQALQRLRKSIEDVGPMMTGYPEYFWTTKGHSIGQR
jgi:hypothetical protein